MYYKKQKYINIHIRSYLYIVNSRIAHFNLGVTEGCLCYIPYLVFTLTYFRAIKHMPHLVEP